MSSLRRFAIAACFAASFALPLFAADEPKYATLKGTIKLEKPPTPEAEKVETDKAVCCKDGDLLSNKYIVDEKSKGLQNVMVWLRPDSENREDKFPAEKIHKDLAKPKSVQHVIDQPKCQFEPRVLVARAGDTLLVKNSASISHNVNIQGSGLTLNTSIPAGKEIKIEEKLVAEDRATTYKCDVHGWMQGRLRVFDHPYFAVTDKDGKFEIKNAPEGKFRIVYQHEGGYHKGKEGLLGFPIEIKGDSKGTMELKPIDIELPSLAPPKNEKQVVAKPAK